MFESTDDLRIAQLRPLIPPAILMEELPLSEKASQTVAATRRALDAILTEEDDRLAVVVGPCSIHDPEAALEYGRFLLETATALSGELCIIMRVYFEKPRTTVGWKGLINDPHLDGSFDINNGLRMARGLLAQLADMGLPAGSEFLDTISPQFIADLICWGAIGARTTESQIHRELASGLSMPVGFKNGTDGNVQIALDAIGAACHPHHFLSVTKQGISAIVETAGNVHCHLILRGGSRGPNYDAASVGAAADKLRAAELPHRIMVDCSHGNSDKDHKRQPAVARDVAQQVAAGARDIFGVMLESHLVEGNQKQQAGSELVYGQSITDACIGWEDTAAVLEELAAAVATRRKG
ncbi:MAG: 3-deoxy-7-phosphoheptulonate synthase [Gemmatimonadetes bacterium]|nr:3-deoxy-7-phosphoheptulonate synthase [Gemmatimonadota bacterium]MDE0965510.1 3-deoxy-7-phosphoheptulonate synthase [Candidatus Latescibacterota bacterium]MBT5328524.1 3-deoxy-7-phosphoheptulonate synthase [Gemmatimonadota bacterium]MBT5452886.1 3-deoxy-7-phosphoheptulonate synthase [Gemmatimonadota bacterium]MBT5802565.1 3-deoxy-7-phosphoheptulonate synthase [Gemmatimonadota bacterium]